jgi:polyisoprenoid-binding protein YceI
MELHADRRPLCVDPSASSSAAMTESPTYQRDTATEGIWTIGSGSIAGFRSQVSMFGHATWIVGQSTGLVGSIQVAGGDVVAGSFRINVATLQIFGRSNAGLDRMIDTTRYPAASFLLNEPILLHATPLINVTYRAPATGSFTMHGITRPVTFTFAARYTGRTLEAAGSIDVAYSDWNLRAPFGIQNNGAIEFHLRMNRMPRGDSAPRDRGAGMTRTVGQSANAS